MSFRRLSTLPLDEEIKDKISRTLLKTVKDVVSLSPLEIMNLLRLSADQCRAFLDQVISLCVPRHTTAYELSLEEERNTIALGSDVLDTMLHGGLHVGSITELVGPSGVGKTQWCLYVAVMAVLTKLSDGQCGSAIYIDTETAFRPERVVEIVSSKYPHLRSEISEYLSKIYVYQPKSVDSLSELLDSIQVIAVERDCRVLLVDSIASLARKEIMAGATGSNITRTNQLTAWAAKLKSVAQQLNICVVVTNQVTTRAAQEKLLITEDTKETCEDQSEETGIRDKVFSHQVTPALGNTWTHCVNTRLILQYTDSTTRQLVIAKSPVAPFASFNYTIEDCGICIEDNHSFYSYSGADPGLHNIKVQKGIIL